MRKFLKTLFCTAAIATMAMIGSAHAALLGTGSVSMAGGWQPTGGDGSIFAATGVHFLPATDNVTITASGGTGAFASLTAGTVGTIKDFTFAPSNAPISDFLVIGGFTFDLTSIGVATHNSTFLDLTGTTTIVDSAGDTGTGSFFFSAQGGGQPPTFSWSATTTSVPEPMTLGLLGLGLAGFGVLRRRAQRQL